MAATDVAVVGFAQTPSVRRAPESEVQLLVPIVTEALQRAGLDRREVGFTKAREQVYQDCVRVADALRPQTRAYHAIWIDGFQLKTDDPFNQAFVDPLYGKMYLPRKFKVAFVIPPVNDLDIFTNDLGFIAVG